MSSLRKNIVTPTTTAGRLREPVIRLAVVAGLAGLALGAAGAGVSWQIDEPGFGDGNRLGTIFDNAMANALDNTNHVPGTLSNFFNDCGGNGGGSPDAACNNDASMAMGFAFVLSANQDA